MIRTVLFACSASTLAFATAAIAGDTPLYAPAPDWIEPVELTDEQLNNGHAEILQDWQHRLEDGVVTTFRDRMVRIENPDALDSEGTLQLTWAPDKGDLTIHALEILRGDETIDLIGQGAQFEVLRRERGLERRLLDGRLTATLAVPGLRQGDTLRLAHSTTIDDQALGEEMQETLWLASDPYQLEKGRAIFSWPEGADVVWQAGPNVDLAEPSSKGGYRWLRAEYPLEKRAEMPGDAPSRFTRAPYIRVGTYADYAELSRTMSPHYEAAADITDVPEMMDHVARIRTASNDPLAQMAMATRIVQDEVSYLLDGLDGGNYLPQNAADTWDKRYGDCKAKSVLLLAMLRELGIDSQAVLVTTQGGDAVPELLPIPANFDHMIVRAIVDGTDYWLDGTSAGTRRANITDVPPFFHALPLTGAGADLVAMKQRAKAQPDVAMTGRFDSSAGVDLPIVYELDITLSGRAATGIRSFVDNATPELERQLARQFTSSMGSGEVTSIDVSYDDDTATGNLLIEGVSDSDFTFEEGKVTSPLGTFTTSIDFGPDRARPAWRDIPVRTNGPNRLTVRSEIQLPTNGGGFALEGDPNVQGTAANTTISRIATLQGSRLLVDEEVSGMLGEIAPSDLAQEKLAARRLSNHALALESVGEPVWRWELPQAELANRVKPIVAAYSAAVDQREDDDFSPLLSRAAFYHQVYMYDRALADYDAVLAEEPTADLHLTRAYLLFDMQDYAAMDAALAKAYELNPDNGTAFFQAEMLSRQGRHDDALALMELLPVGEDERDSYVENMALNLGRAGDVESGYAMLAERLADKTQNADLLNADCWFRGLHAVELGDAVSQCTRAVERAEYPAAALDSRAMVHYRNGDIDAAIKDLDDAIRLAPALSAAYFMRGVMRMERGEKDGREDIAVARRLTPGIDEFYALYGIEAD